MPARQLPTRIRCPRRQRRRQVAPLVLAVLLCMAAVATAADPVPAPTADPERVRLPEQQVVGAREEIPPFLAPVEEVEIYAGKKTTVIDPAEPPKIVNDNYRQALSRVPGLILAEESTPLVSIGYRGLDPHRSQFTQILKDGIPIHADQFGYPEAYYMPPLDSIEQINFVHGGASLLYGPQIGGALNFVTRKPNPTTPFSLYSSQTFGSDEFYSTYNALSGTVDDLGYYVYYYQKQGDGFRDANSDFSLYSGSAKVTYQLNDTNRLLVAFDGYNEEHGEPGGLRRTPAENGRLYQDDREATTRFFDKFELERYMGWGLWESDLGPDTLLRVSAWGGRYERRSFRQRGGGFGTLPSGDAASTNAIENQRFNTGGIDARVRHDWEAFDETHTVTAGIEYFHTSSPRTDERGARPDARSGALRNKNTRTTNYGAAFAENRFVWKGFSFTPAIRLENYALGVDEKVNVDKAAAGVALADETNYDFQPLFGLGFGYEIRPGIEAYANISSAYRPQIFTQAVSVSPTVRVAGNLDPSVSYQYEIGLRGNPVPFAWWDTSFFYFEIEDQIGTVQLTDETSEIRNVGEARHYGWEVAAEVGTLGFWDHVHGTELATRFGDLSLYGNLTLLDAEYTDGPFENNTPAYAPDYLVRAGFQYAYPGIVKLSMLTTASSQFFANDNNTEDFDVPAYDVWDLTMEANVWRDTVALHFGVNNLFDTDYFSRVRSDGIDPAYGRFYYGGIKVYF